MVQTYLARRASTGEVVLGFVSLLSDAVILGSRERKRLDLRQSDHPVVPALKVARLGVASHLQRGNGIGTALLRFAYDTALDIAERVGCRLLTVDAYPESLTFYEGRGFVRNKAKEYRTTPHPSMRFNVFASNLPAWVDGSMVEPKCNPMISQETSTVLATEE